MGFGSERVAKELDSSAPKTETCDGDATRATGEESVAATRHCEPRAMIQAACGSAVVSGFVAVPIRKGIFGAESAKVARSKNVSKNAQSIAIRRSSKNAGGMFGAPAK